MSEREHFCLARFLYRSDADLFRSDLESKFPDHIHEAYVLPCDTQYVAVYVEVNHIALSRREAGLRARIVEYVEGWISGFNYAQLDSSRHVVKLL